MHAKLLCNRVELLYTFPIFIEVATKGMSTSDKIFEVYIDIYSTWNKE